MYSKYWVISCFHGSLFLVLGESGEIPNTFGDNAADGYNSRRSSCVGHHIARRDVMNFKIACMLLVTVSLGAGGEPVKQKKELAKLAGTWSLSELKYDGEEHKLKFSIVFK